MRLATILLVAIIGLGACKNNGKNTSSVNSEKAKPVAKTPKVEQIIVDPSIKPVKPDFRVLEMSVEADVLTVLVSYGGGCEEHSFKAYFSGGWSKSLPPQAALTLEHLNPNNDACRSIVRDTLRFDAKPLQYSASKEVMITWSANPETKVLYSYGR